MKTLSLPDTFTGCCTPDGSLVALYPDGRPDPRFATSRDFGATFQRVPLPGPNVRYQVCDVIQGVLCIGCSALAGDRAHLWNGTRWIALVDKDGHPVICYGVSACAFGPYGLYVSTPGTVDNVKIFDPLTGVHTGSYGSVEKPLPVGASGFASVEGLGPEGVHPQDQWYGHFGLGEYVITGGYAIGQGTVHDGLMVADRGYLIASGLCQFNRVHHDGDQFATASWQSKWFDPDTQTVKARTVFLWPTRAELDALPSTPIPPVEPPVEPIDYDLKPQMEAERAKYPTPLTEDMPAKITNAVAWNENQRLGRPVWGLSVKPNGNHVPSPQGVFVAYDILEVKDEHRLFDCLTGDLQGIVTWGETTYHNDPQGRPWLAPIAPDGAPTPPTGNTHRYVGGGNDTGTCDQCGQPRVSDIHRVPEGKVPHQAWLGEDGIGTCDLCFQPVEAPIHGSTAPPTDCEARVAQLKADLRELRDACNEMIVMIDEALDR
jgi:hypothetical protein